MATSQLTQQNIQQYQRQSVTTVKTTNHRSLGEY